MVCPGKSIRISLSVCKLCGQYKTTVQNATQNYEIQRGDFRFVSEFFTGGFSAVLTVVNTRYLILRDSVIYKLTRIRNNGLLQATDR